METFKGWLLDMHLHPRDGLVFWLLEEGSRPGAPRRRFKQAFPITFYAAGPDPRLRCLWRYLAAQPEALKLGAAERRELFQEQPLRLLAAEVRNPADQELLFKRVSQAFPDLNYYDADILPAMRHSAQYGSFPLARLQVCADSQGWVQGIQALDSPWDLDPPPPPLRILHLEPDSDPNRRAPTSLKVRLTSPFRGERRSCCLPLEPARPLLVNLAAILRQADPDLILSAWGDTWTLPLLLDLSDKLGIPLPLNRELDQPVTRKRAHSYFTYGQVVHRGQQVHLVGRWHLDTYNAMMFHDYGLDGIFESARVSGMPVQLAGRLSPGSGISAMQVVTALRSQVLVPWHKQQVEEPKSALELIHADQGGLVYQPRVGLHRDVAEIDFVSMYPGIMVRFNISPETVGKDKPHAVRVPALDLWIDQEKLGLVPVTLAPLLEKLITLKHRLAALPRWDPRRGSYKAQAAAHKWLLVTCFGYLGYKNARFGRIEAHESVTAYSREALLLAKEAAEDLGFEVLHMYIDGLWVQKPACRSAEDIQPLLDEIARRTRLPIALEGIYRWVVFLPSRVNPKAPVPNRYFGVFQDGSVKVRGIEARRQDTPPFVVEAQLDLLGLLAQAAEDCQPGEQLQQVAALLRRQVRDLRLGRVPVEKLVVTQRLSRELAHYRVPSPAARAAAQLVQAGKTLHPGQAVRFVFTRGEPGVYAWDLPEPPDLAWLDLARYRVLLLRAAATLLQPLGIDEAVLALWLDGGRVCLPARPVLPLFKPALKFGVAGLQNPGRLVRNRPDGPGLASNPQMDNWSPARLLQSVAAPGLENPGTR